MTKDVECPYCEKWQDICHDDGFGYEEDEVHEQECDDCGKTFVFYTSISYDYESNKADCLNGGKHDLEKTHCYPKELSRWVCKDCDYDGGLVDPEGPRKHCEHLDSLLKKPK